MARAFASRFRAACNRPRCTGSWARRGLGAAKELGARVTTHERACRRRREAAPARLRPQCRAGVARRRRTARSGGLVGTSKQREHADEHADEDARTQRPWQLALRFVRHKARRRRVTCAHVMRPGTQTRRLPVRGHPARDSAPGHPKGCTSRISSAPSCMTSGCTGRGCPGIGGPPLPGSPPKRSGSKPGTPGGPAMTQKTRAMSVLRCTAVKFAGAHRTGRSVPPAARPAAAAARGLARLRPERRRGAQGRRACRRPGHQMAEPWAPAAVGVACLADTGPRCPRHTAHWAARAHRPCAHVRPTRSVRHVGCEPWARCSTSTPRRQ